MSCLCLLTVGDLMHLVISGEKLLETGPRREVRTRDGRSPLLDPQKAALPCPWVRGCLLEVSHRTVLWAVSCHRLEVSEKWNVLFLYPAQCHLFLFWWKQELYERWGSSAPPHLPPGALVKFCWVPSSGRARIIKCNMAWWEAVRGRLKGKRAFRIWKALWVILPGSLKTTCFP